MTKQLALHGGRPVRLTPLSYGRQSVDDADVDAVVEALRSDFLTTGPLVAKFEEVLAARLVADHVVAMSNGTAALHAAVAVSGISPKDEVIVPALTFAATANCVRYLGGTVVFADVRPDTLTIDPRHVSRLITPNTKAIIAVDYAGQPADLEELKSLAVERNLTLIEDAAHSLGATYRGLPIGSIADLTTFSFHPVKHITTGEGGAVSTQSPTLARQLGSFRNHGITSDHRSREEANSWFYEMPTLGYNYRLTDLQCALGLSQLQKLTLWLARRRVIAKAYDAALADLGELVLPTRLADRESAWHLYPVRLRLERLSCGRAKVFEALRAENIGVNVHYIPVPWHPYYQRLGYRRGGWPNAEAAYEELLSLPMFPAMTDGDVSDVVEAVRKVVRHFAIHAT